MAGRPPAPKPRTPDPQRQQTAERPAGNRPSPTKHQRRPTRRQARKSRPRPPPRRTTAPKPAAATDRRQRPGRTRPADATKEPRAEEAHAARRQRGTKRERRNRPQHTPHTSPEDPPRPGATRPTARPQPHGDQRSPAAQTGARPRRAHGCARPPRPGTDSPARLAPGQRGATQQQRCGRAGRGAAAGRWVMDASAKWRTGLPVPWRVLAPPRSTRC